jgi:hypothetical protein
VDDQRIIFFITDSVDIDLSSIRMTVNGILFDITDPELSFFSDSLIFSPSIPWTDGQRIDYCLDSLCNIYGIHEDRFCSSFRIDLTHPVLLSYSPSTPFITSASIPVSFSIMDTLSGINPASLVLSINGTPYTGTSLTTTWDTYILNIVLYSHPDFAHNDTIFACLRASDSPDYCAPNVLDTCFSFIVDLLGPVASLPYIGTPTIIAVCLIRTVSMYLVPIMVSVSLLMIHLIHGE